MTDIELRAGLLMTLQKVVSQPVPSPVKQVVTLRKRDKKRLEKMRNKRWNTEEDSKLREGFQLYGREWPKLVEHVSGGRTKKQIYLRAYALKLL